MSTINIIRHRSKVCNRMNGTHRRARVAFSLLAAIFVIVTAIVYVFTPSDAPRPRQVSLTATVIMPQAPAEDAALQQTIITDANLARALGTISSSARKLPSETVASLTDASIADIRRGLNVEVSTAKTSDDASPQTELSITYSGQADAAQACWLVDLLAEQTARQDTDKRRAAAQRDYKQAKQAADNAHKKLVAAQAQYDAFVNLYFSAGQTSTPLATPLGDPASGQANQATPGPLPPGTTLSKPTPGLRFVRPDWTAVPKSTRLNNPRWTELNNQLAALMARRAVLLEKMTPIHPEVQNLDLEIEDLERKIASTARELPRPPRGSLPPITPMPPSATDDLIAPGGEGRGTRILANAPVARPQVQPQLIAPQGDETSTTAQLQPPLQKEFSQKREALDTARHRFERLSTAERDAWQALADVKPAEVVSAVCPTSLPAAQGRRSGWLLIVASLVGFCAAAGVGLFSLGISPPVCFANAAEVRAALKIPVLGTIPAVDVPVGDDHIDRMMLNIPAMAAAIILILAALIISATIVF